MVYSVEPTAIPTASVDRERRQADDFQQRIISSKEDVDGNAQLQLLQQRQNRALTVTFTTTTTSYVYSSTVVKKTISLVAAADNGKVTCLPIGFVVC